MILTFDELMEKVKTLTEGKTDDETITLIEDISDTLNAKQEGSTNEEDWKEKYETMDSAWRAKYKERFFNSSAPEKEIEVKEEVKEKIDSEEIEIDDLFKEKEEK